MGLLGVLRHIIERLQKKDEAAVTKKIEDSKKR